jgi:hypothetical protein
MTFRRTWAAPEPSTSISLTAQILSLDENEPQEIHQDFGRSPTNLKRKRATDENEEMRLFRRVRVKSSKRLPAAGDPPGSDGSGECGDTTPISSSASVSKPNLKKRQRSREPREPDWKKFYEQGLPEVIVIDDSPTPEPISDEDSGLHGQNGTWIAPTSKRFGRERRAQEIFDEIDDDVDIIDPEEPRYCVCNGVSFGIMIGCENNDASSSCRFQMRKSANI